MQKVRENISIIFNLKDETVIALVDNFEASRLEFTFDATQIMISAVGTEEPYRRCGYARLLFEALKIVAEQEKMPIVVWSVTEAIPFYEAVGFSHLNSSDVRKCVKVGNANEEKITEGDFVWLPQSLGKRKSIIFL